MLPIGDATTRVAEYVLDGLETRSQVRANNIANVNTPGYRALTVDFETSLESAIERGRIDRVERPTARPAGTVLNPRAGTTVDLEEELIGMTRDTLLRQAMVNAFNFKVALTRSAIGTR